MPIRTCAEIGRPHRHCKHGHTDDCREADGDPGECELLDEPHDYEAGDYVHPMHVEPLCRICGLPKRSPSHV